MQEPRTAATPLAARRAFRSKVDRIRPTYGFEDVSLAPGDQHRRARRRRPRPRRSRGLPLAIPVLAAAMDAVVDAGFAGALARSRRSRGPEPRGRPDALRRPAEVLERIATAPESMAQAVLAEAYQAPDPRGPGRAADRGDPCRGFAGRRRRPPRPPRAGSGPFCAEHGADLFLVQSQVSSARHLATGYDPL